VFLESSKAAAQFDWLRAQIQGMDPQDGYARWGELRLM